MKGQHSTLWKAVEAGEIPAHYGWQVEHQLMVSGAAQAYLYVFDGNSGKGLPLEVIPPPERWPQIHAAWDAFMHCIETDTPPELTERDKVICQDEDWRLVSEQYL